MFIDIFISNLESIAKTLDQGVWSNLRKKGKIPIKGQLYHWVQMLIGGYPNQYISGKCLVSFQLNITKLTVSLDNWFHFQIAIFVRKIFLILSQILSLYIWNLEWETANLKLFCVTFLQMFEVLACLLSDIFPCQTYYPTVAEFTPYTSLSFWIKPFLGIAQFLKIWSN